MIIVGDIVRIKPNTIYAGDYIYDTVPVIIEEFIKGKFLSGRYIQPGTLTHQYIVFDKETAKKYLGITI